MGEEVLMTSREVCRYCRFSKSVLGRLDRQELLVPARRLPASGRRLYRESEVAAYMDKLKSKDFFLSLKKKTQNFSLYLVSS